VSTNPDPFLIRAAASDDFGLFADIERRADCVYLGLPGFETYNDLPDKPAQAYRSLPPGRRISVAATKGGLVGFIYSVPLGRFAQIEQISVVPEAQNRGIGQALIAEIDQMGRADGFACLTLATFCDVAWNAPFYARLGFSAMAPDRMSPEIRHMAKIDGASPWSRLGARVVMVRYFRP
jgi:ribosomal protein S18 acetylase RimI-like enzyme